MEQQVRFTELPAPFFFDRSPSASPCFLWCHSCLHKILYRFGCRLASVIHHQGKFFVYKISWTWFVKIFTCLIGDRAGRKALYHHKYLHVANLILDQTSLRLLGRYVLRSSSYCLPLGTLPGGGVNFFGHSRNPIQREFAFLTKSRDAYKTTRWKRARQCRFFSYRHMHREEYRKCWHQSSFRDARVGVKTLVHGGSVDSDEFGNPLGHDLTLRSHPDRESFADYRHDYIRGMAQTRFPFYLPPPHFPSSSSPFSPHSLYLSVASPSLSTAVLLSFLLIRYFSLYLHLSSPFSLPAVCSVVPCRFAEELAHATGKNNANKRGWQDGLACVDNWHLVN